jgi:molecular chaperone GrpE (heat shock protein)
MLSMTKQRLQEKLIDFQRDIISLSQKLQSKKQAFQDSEDNLLLELMLVLDAFENIFKHLEEKEATFEKSVRRSLQSFKGIQRKIMRTLEERGVEKIEFPDGKAVIGLCKVVETRAVDGLEEGEIIAIVCNGYRRADRVLRPAEVITVANRT